MAFVGGHSVRAQRRSSPKACRRVRLHAAPEESPERVARRERMFEWYEKWDGTTENRDEGWILIYGVERGEWHNKNLEAGLGPPQMSFWRFGGIRLPVGADCGHVVSFVPWGLDDATRTLQIPDAELEYFINQKMQEVHVLMQGSSSVLTLEVETGPGRMVLAFEAAEDAESYAVGAEALGAPPMIAQACDAQDVINYARQENMYRAIIPAGTLFSARERPEEDYERYLAAKARRTEDEETSE